MRILVVGCNHKTAPLAIRERVAFDAEGVLAALQTMRQRFPHAEGVLLSTCNRVEFYIARPTHQPPQPEEVVALLAELRGLPVEALMDVLYRYTDRGVAEHLMGVASSLDSMVLGETQILGQVRVAFQTAQQAGVVGPVLGRLCQDAIATAKRIHSQTELSAGRSSIASAAIQFAQQIFAELHDKTVLIVGAGKMGEQTADRLVDLGPKGVLVVNRSRERAERLAGRYNGQVVDYANFDDALTRADIVVSSTGSPEPVITVERMKQVMKARRYRPIFLIDIAVPRDVEAAAGQLEHVYLYNIDDLQRVVEATASERAGQLVEAQAILEQQVNGFMSWLRARALGPTIGAFCRRLADLRADELSWLMPKLSEQVGDRDRQLIEQMTHRLINKVMHDPVRELTESCEPGSSAVDVHTQSLIKLFRLDVDEEG